MTMTKTVRTLAILLSLSSLVRAESSQEKFWKKTIENCNPTALANNKDWYFGSTNAIGPGSVWGVAGGTPNSIGSAKHYFGSDTAVAAELNPSTSPATCDAASAPSWDVSVGIPLTIASVGNAEVDASIQNAKTIQVAIDKTWVESMGTASFEDALYKIDHNSAFYTEAVSGKAYMLSSAVVVQGIKITFTLKNSLSVAAQAQFAAGPVVSIGTADNPAKVKVDVGNAGSTVTVTSVGKTYILGRLLKIDKIKPKDIGQGPTPPAPTTPANQVASDTGTGKKPHVNARVPN
jgi:hypothetical protein